MKARTWKRAVRGLAFAWLAVAEATSARAQVEDDAVTVPLVFYSEFFTLGGEASISVTGPGASASGYTTYPNPLWMNTNQAVAQVRPGKDYYFSVTVQNLQQWRPRFSAPVGMKVFVSDVERPGVNYSPSYYFNTIKVRVEDPTIAGPGEASGLRPGRVIWSAGLGALKNGDTAGVISLRELGLTANSYTPAALNYDTSSTDVSRIFVSGTSTLRQVFAPQCLADITAPNSYSFRLKFYGRPQITTQNGDLTWNVTGTPFVEYLVENSSYPSTTKLKITRTANFGGTKSWWTEIEKIGSDWKVTDWTESSLSALSTVRYAYADFDRDETIEARDGSYVSTFAQTKNRFEDFAWGRELTSAQAGFGGSNPLVTSITYETNSSTWGAYTRAKWRVHPTGNWEGIAYTSLGLPSRICRPFLDAPTTPQNTSESVGDVTSILYGAAWDNIYSRPTNVTRRINNVQVGQTSTVFNETTTRLSRYDNLPSPNNPTTLPLVVATSQEYSSAGASVTTITTSYREDAEAVAGPRRLPGLPHSIRRPDNTMEVHLYFRGTYDAWWRQFYTSPTGLAFAEYVLQGTTAPQSGDGSVLLTSYGPSDQSNYIASNFYVVPGKSTMSVAVRDFDGTFAMTQSYVYTTSGWVLVDRVTTVYDATYHVFPTNVRRDSGNASSAGDTANIMEVSENGWQYGRLQWTADQSGAKRWFAYDVKGRLTQERLEPITGQPQAGEQWTIHTFDPVDRETRTTLAGNGTGGDPSNDVVTETDYDLAGRVTQTRRWGQSDWIRTYHYYFIGGNSRISQITQPSGGTTVSEVHLDGRSRSVTGTAQPPKYFGYYVGSNGYIRTQENLNNVQWGDGWTDVERDWLGRTNYVARPTGNSSTNFDNLTYNSLGQLVARQLNVTSGSSPLLAASRYVYGSMGEVTREGLDVNENSSLDDTGIDRVTLRGYAFVQPYDGSWWRETTTKRLTNSANASDGVLTTTRERLTGKTAANQSETRVIDANNQVTTNLRWVDRANRTVEERSNVPGSSTTAKNVTKNGYLAQTISPEGVTSTYTYDVYGRLTKVQGRESVTEEKTYYAKSTLIKNLRNALMKPSSEGGALGGSEWQVLSYDSAGRMATHQTHNVWVWKTARYEYDAANRLTRQWGDAATPVEYVYSTYGWRTHMRLYRNGSNWNASTWAAAVSGATAETTEWKYQGPTGLTWEKVDPALRRTTFTFNHRNQVVTREWERLVPAGQPNAGQRVRTTYGYCDSAGYRTGETASVSYNDGTPNVSYQYNWGGTYTRTGAVQGVQDVTAQRWFSYRSHDQQLDFEYVGYSFYGSSGSSGRGIWRDYDGLGRTTGFRAGYGNDTTAIQQTTYGYDPTTARVSSVGSWHPSIGWKTFTYAYRANSNLVEVVAGSGFGFRRDTTWSGWRNLADNVITSWSGATKANFHYDYDWVEQRTGEDHNDALSGLLGYGSGVDTGYLLTPRGELEEVTATNGAAPILNRYRDWTYDTAGNRTIEYFSGGNKSFTGNSLNQYTAVGGVAHSYDLDGNLVDDGVWTYSWDAENRMTVAQKKDNTKRLELSYDFQGRRVRKIVRNGGEGAPISRDRKYLYNTWNLIAEVRGENEDASMGVERAFVWGLDNTGTIHGGGGVGGLLQHCSPAGYLAFPVYDGNGNVRAMLDSGGGIYAAFGYSAFGEVVDTVGATSTVPFRFATKWQDEETGLYHYNHRYFSPTLGRFISRDPIAENGGLNLYGYCANDPIGHWDYLGLDGGVTFAAVYNVVRWAMDIFAVFDGLFGHRHRPYVSPYSRLDNPQDRSFQRFATDEFRAANSGWGDWGDFGDGFGIDWGGLSDWDDFVVYIKRPGSRGKKGGRGMTDMGATDMSALQRMYQKLNEAIQRNDQRAVERLTTQIEIFTRATGLGGRRGPATISAPGSRLQTPGEQMELPMTNARGSRSDKTQGVLVTADGRQNYIISGREGAAKNVPPGSPGQDIVTRTHVEGHAAATMQREGIQVATLYLNNIPCPSCVRNLPQALPPGSILTVVYSDGTSVVFRGAQ